MATERIVKDSRLQRITNFVKNGGCIYKDNWCDGGFIGGKSEFDKEPCRYYIKGRCTHPSHPDNVVEAREIR